MAKEIDKIIQSKTAPKSNNVLWDDGENLKINRNGKWESAGGGAPMINITYANLVTLRNNGELIAGMQYRITDYVTTTAQENTLSAGHPFDIIVLALSENTLVEEAYAIQSARDTDGYFANSKLVAWKLWYCLDNDINKFAWADTANGKGVIYRMIDECNNDLPYDFKNIMYVDMTKLKILAEAMYYGSWWAGELVRQPSSNTQGYYAWVLTNVTGPGSSGIWYTKSYDIESVDTLFYEYDGNKYNISETLIITNIMKGEMQYTFGNTLIPSSLLSEFVDYTTIGKNCYNNTIKEGHIENNKQSLNYIIFNNNCYNNSFGNNCYNNSFGNNCHDNSFGNNCYNNSFGNSCHDNSFGNNCCYLELNESTSNKTASINSNGEAKVFNLADLADLLNS